MSKLLKTKNVTQEKDVTSRHVTPECDSVTLSPKGSVTVTLSHRAGIRQIMPALDGMVAWFSEDHPKTYSRKVVALALVDNQNLDEKCNPTEGTWPSIEAVCVGEGGFFIASDSDAFVRVEVER